MAIVIVDGYLDEPGCLGVPPYVSPQVRYLYGSALDEGADVRYQRIEDWRKNRFEPESRDLVFLFGGMTVPGKYLRGYPMSPREAKDIAAQHRGHTVLSGPIAQGLPKNDSKVFSFVSKKDPDAFLADLLETGMAKDRRRKPEERRRWSVLGANLLSDIPEGPERSIMEVELFRGCPRYITGGCSFCSEPLFGKPEFRPVGEVVDEVEALFSKGGVNLRLGAQSCIFSYLAEGVGVAEIPKPVPEIHEKLFSEIWKRAPGIRVLHVDNANPAVMANHKNEAKEILGILVKYTTPGNVLAMGLESADPVVQRKNNLNTNAQETLEAVEMVNQVGAKTGENGMPRLLPGLNFVFGLPGESANTYKRNKKFLKDVSERSLLLRRINLRQVIRVGRDLAVSLDKGEFLRFKKWVRENVDQPMLRRVVPRFQVLKEAMVEKVEGNWSYLRHLGTYPLLFAVPYKLPMWSFHDLSVVDWGFRSVTCIEHPFFINKASFSQLTAIPGIGKKRAATIFRNIPYEDADEILAHLPDFEPLEGWTGLFSFEK